MKHLFIILSLLYSAQLFAQSALAGVWQRVQDESATDTEIFAGNRIEVTKVDGKWVGIFLDVSPDASAYGYKPGQIKWKNIKKAGKKGFKCALLLTDPEDFEDPTLYKRLKANMILIESDDVLFIRFDEWYGDGDKQKFIRIEDNPS